VPRCRSWPDRASNSRRARQAERLPNHPRHPAIAGHIQLAVDNKFQNDVIGGDDVAIGRGHDDIEGRVATTSWSAWLAPTSTSRTSASTGCARCDNYALRFMDSVTDTEGISDPMVPRPEGRHLLGPRWATT
jgi:hypothetical protein